MNRRLAICLAALLWATTACSTIPEGSSKSQETESERPPGAQSDGASASGELDQAGAFDIFLSQELGVINYARSNLIAECMADRGFPQMSELPDRGPQPVSILNFDLESLGPITEKQARDNGFGAPPQPEPPQVLSNDSSYDGAYEECRAQSMNLLGVESESTVSDYYELGNQVYSTFAARLSESSGLREALGQVVDCMSDRGFPPDDRDALLDDLDMSHFGVDFGQVVYELEGDTPTNEPGTVEVLQPGRGADYLPTPEEVELALVFVECRTTTGFNEDVATLISQKQTQVVDEYEAQFVELNPQIEDLARVAAEATG